MVEHDLKHKFQRRKKKNQKKTMNLTNINTEGGRRRRRRSGWVEKEAYGKGFIKAQSSSRENHWC